MLKVHGPALMISGEKRDPCAAVRCCRLLTGSVVTGKVLGRRDGQMRRLDEVAQVFEQGGN